MLWVKFWSNIQHLSTYCQQDIDAEIYRFILPKSIEQSCNSWQRWRIQAKGCVENQHKHRFNTRASCTLGIFKHFSLITRESRMRWESVVQEKSANKKAIAKIFKDMKPVMSTPTPYLISQLSLKAFNCCEFQRGWRGIINNKLLWL